MQLIGIITYDNEHLKTEQLVFRIKSAFPNSKLLLVMAPFIERKPRQVFFSHRPNQACGLHPLKLATLDGVTAIQWDKETALPQCDLFLVAGAGILDPNLANGTPIINAHPGIIPTVRGLDAFKWAILNNLELGITLHKIDENIDKGEILAVRKTDVFTSDTLDALARRHYENELNLLTDFSKHLSQRINVGTPVKKPTKRMSFKTEKLMLKNFENFKCQYAK